MKLLDLFTALTATGSDESIWVTAFSYSWALFDCLTKETIITGQHHLWLEPRAVGGSPAAAITGSDAVKACGDEDTQGQTNEDNV